MRIEPMKKRFAPKGVATQTVESLWLDPCISVLKRFRYDRLNNDEDAIRLADEAFGVPQLPEEKPESIKQLFEWHKLVRLEMRAEYGIGETALALVTRIRASG